MKNIDFNSIKLTKEQQQLLKQHIEWSLYQCLLTTTNCKDPKPIIDTYLKYYFGAEWN